MSNTRTFDDSLRTSTVQQFFSKVYDTSIRPASDQKTLELIERHFIYCFGALHDCAWDRGHALAPHGSLSRDIDLVSIPWRPDAESATYMAKAFEAKLRELYPNMPGLTEVKGASNPKHFREGCPGAYPHGRRVWSFHLDNKVYIDLSIMPTFPRSNPFGD